MSETTYKINTERGTHGQWRVYAFVTDGCATWLETRQFYGEYTKAEAVESFQEHLEDHGWHLGEEANVS